MLCIGNIGIIMKNIYIYIFLKKKIFRGEHVIPSISDAFPVPKEVRLIFV